MDNIKLEATRLQRQETRNANLTFVPRTGRPIARLEDEWGRYKYAVLERSQRAYDAIRELLKDKDGYPVEAFYRQIDFAAAAEPTPTGSANAAQHVWGHFKKYASDAEKRAFQTVVERYLQSKTAILEVKDYLWTLTIRHDEKYLKNAYYFTGI